MMDLCVPQDTDWSCRFTTEEFAAAIADPAIGPLITLAEQFAWYHLASLTNYRIAVCPIKVRPVVRREWVHRTYRVAPVRGGASSALGFYYGPFITGGAWVNACGCMDACSCSNIPTVTLPGPIGHILEVRVDGAVLPRTAYRVMNGNRLVRTDGEKWPVCQDLTVDDEHGFTVSYFRGMAPNPMTKRAAGVLANEFLLACQGDPACRLPYNVKTVARQGETYDFTERDFLDGDTGIPEVQALIRMLNPNQLKSPVIVASPDDYMQAVPTWN